ncbi:DUF3592 domain-containing protein [Xanthobacter sp. KR7-225]|uniref:DUF3592 domain-containing protein n=1 Tax=Xanthobacter sp. KR7-225 TaxID=3156613 RepID=UPI0032B61EB0
MLETVVRILAYLASFGALGGVVFAAVAAGARAKARRVADWPRVRGRVVQLPAAPRPFGTLAPGLRYRYPVDGRLHESSRLTLLDWPAGVWPDPGAFARRYGTPGDVEVFVNPKLSDDALLDRAVPPARAVHLGLAVALACTLLVLARRLLA